MDAAPVPPPIVAVLKALAEHLDEVSERLVARIRVEVPSYARLPHAEHQRTVHMQTRILIDGLIAGAAPSADQLRPTQQAARRRAYYGLPIYDVLAAFHIVGRDLWDTIRQTPDTQESLLIDLVAPLWVWIQALSGAVVDAFAQDADMRHGVEVALRARLLDSLGAGTAVEQASGIARELAFDPAGPFQAFCAPRDQWADGQVEMLQRATRQLPGVVHCGMRGGLMIALAQDADEAELAERIDRLGGARSVLGIGLERGGLAGADLSIGDGERALHLAQLGGTRAVRFAESWLRASLIDSRDRLAPLLAGPQRAAAAHPDLAVAVRAFAAAGLSLAGAAETLGVHPNTVAYRLNRWHTLTGIDARSVEGLIRSVVALGLDATTER